MFFLLFSAYFFILTNASIIHRYQSPMTIPLVYDDVTSEYYAKISMGTPPQYFNAMIDVQNSHFWIISDKCDANVYPLCEGSRFESESSSTYNTTGKKVEFIGGGSGSGISKTNEGYISMDATRIGTKLGPEIVLEDQVFIEASAVRDGINPFALSAVFGLAPAENSSPKIKTLTEAMIDSKIARFTLSIDAVWGFGQLVFDSPEDSMRNQGTQIPLSDPNKWQFNSDLINVGNSTLCETECKANVDIRAWEIFFPINIAEKLAKTVHGHFNPEVRAVFFPQTKIQNIPNLDIKVTNQVLSLNITDYTSCFSGECILNLGSSETEWVLGQPFLAKFDTEFNFRDKTLSFTAKA